MQVLIKIWQSGFSLFLCRHLYYFFQEEVYGRWNGLMASREATSLTIIWRLPIIHDQIEQPPTLYLLSFVFYFYIYITIEWGEVITIIWGLPIVHDQIERPPTLYYLLSFVFYFYIYIPIEWGEVITIIWRLPIVHDQIKWPPIFLFFVFYFTLIFI